MHGDARFFVRAGALLTLNRGFGFFLNGLSPLRDDKHARNERCNPKHHNYEAAEDQNKNPGKDSGAQHRHQNKVQRHRPSRVIDQHAERAHRAKQEEHGQRKAQTLAPRPFHKGIGLAG